MPVDVKRCCIMAVLAACSLQVIGIDIDADELEQALFAEDLDDCVGAQDGSCLSLLQRTALRRTEVRSHSGASSSPEPGATAGHEVEVDAKDVHRTNSLSGPKDMQGEGPAMIEKAIFKDDAPIEGESRMAPMLMQMDAVTETEPTGDSPADASDEQDVLEVAQMFADTRAMIRRHWSLVALSLVLLPLLALSLGFTLAAALCPQRLKKSDNLLWAWLRATLEVLSMHLRASAGAGRGKTAVRQRRGAVSARSRNEELARKQVTAVVPCNAARLQQLLPSGLGYDCDLARPFSSGKAIRFECKVEGVSCKAEGSSLLSAPLTKRACVHFEAWVGQAAVGGAAPTEPEEVANATAGTSFQVSLLDAPDVCFELQSADLQLFHMSEGAFAARQSFSSAPTHWQDFTVLNHSEGSVLTTTAAHEFRENALLVGSKITLFGELLRDAKGALSVQPWLDAVQLTKVLVSDDPTLSLAVPAQTAEDTETNAAFAEAVGGTAAAKTAFPLVDRLQALLSAALGAPWSSANEATEETPLCLSKQLLRA